MRTQWLFVGIVGVIVGLSNACTMDVELVRTNEEGHNEGGGGSGGSGGTGGGGMAKPFWENAPHDMKQARAEHTMTELEDGRVLIAGGYGTGPITNALDSAEIWDPKTMEFTSVAPMNSRRARHTATRLANGNVVVTGGYNGSIETNSMEVYNPTTNKWTMLPETLPVGRMYHAAIVLPNDQLLTASGCCDLAYGTAETTAVASNMPAFPLIVKPSTPMNIGHAGVTLTLLADGRPLLVGNAAIPTTEWYDVTSDTWKPAANLNVARNAHTANLNASGMLVVAGGITLVNNASIAINSVEEYDFKTNQWTLLPSMQQTRLYHSGTLIRIHGQEEIVWVGGVDTNGSTLSSCERSAGEPCPDLNIARALHQALVVTVNGQKRVMVTGGWVAGGQPTNSVEWLRW